LINVTHIATSPTKLYSIIEIPLYTDTLQVSIIGLLYTLMNNEEFKH